MSHKAESAFENPTPNNIAFAVGFSGKARAGKSWAADQTVAYCNEHGVGKNVCCIPFAEPLKLVCGLLLGWDAETAMSDLSKKTKITTIFLADSTVKDIVSLLCKAPYYDVAYALEFGFTHERMYTRMWDGLRTLLYHPEGEADGLHRFLDHPDGVTYGLLLQLVGTEVMRNHVSRHIFANYVLAEAIRRRADVLVCPDVRMEEEFDMLRSIGGFVARIRGARHTLDDGRSATHSSEVCLDGVVMETLENTFDQAFSQVVRGWIAEKIKATD